MGQVTARHADRLVITSDNPRGEDPQQIVDQVVAGVLQVAGIDGRYRAIVDRRQAIHAALADAGSGDLVVLAGKGHETTLTIAGRCEPFDDREVARQELAALGWQGEGRAGA